MFQRLFILTILSFFLTSVSSAQVNDNQTGGWYMYFWNTGFAESEFGLQGDIQYRNWNLGGDLEQLLLRGGLTWAPKQADVKLTLGYGHITSGTPGESTSTSIEHRIYQEALLPQLVAKRILLTHRFRFEQRWVENQDFRSRVRYNLFLNVPLNQPTLNANALYLAFYNEIFINTKKNIGDGREVSLFDRNRLYTALGYALKDNLKLQLGYMEQTTNSLSKGQIQLSLHQSF